MYYFLVCLLTCCLQVIEDNVEFQQLILLKNHITILMIAIMNYKADMEVNFRLISVKKTFHKLKSLKMNTNINTQNQYPPQ